MNCHVETGGGSSLDMHWRAVTKAHGGNERSSAGVSAVDDMSRSCLKCHDGVTASDAGHETSRGGGYSGDRSRNHPVGVRYPPSGTRGVEVPLRPASLLPKSIRLPGGKVSCVSCHDVYNRDRHRLSVPIEGSKLCMTCHVMD